MHGYDMGGWNMGWMWIPAVVLIIALALTSGYDGEICGLFPKLDTLFGGRLDEGFASSWMTAYGHRGPFWRAVS